MMPLLVFRERVKNFYQKYDTYLIPAIKFIFALVSFLVINKEIGYDARLRSIPIVLALSLLSAFTPSAIMILLACFVVVLHVYSVSPFLSIIVILLLMIIYFLFARFTPRFGYVLLAIPILYFLKIPYLIPILLGVIATPIAIVPTSCGVFIYYIIKVIKESVSMQETSSVSDILNNYTYVIDHLKDKELILSVVIFALILLVVYYVRRMRFDYAFEMSIAAGALTSILGFLVSDIILDQTGEIIFMIVGTVLSTGIVYAVHFFKLTLDYSATEYVQFEDDVYYYYVKAVPKITVTTPQMKIKHINVKNSVHGLSKNGFHKSGNFEEDDLKEEESFLESVEKDENSDKI
jgi:hypothetical protein